MAEEADKTPQEQIKEGIWRIALQTVVILVAIAFGVFIGYTMWGDAPVLKAEVGSLNEQIIELKNEREGASARQAMCERDKKDFKERLDKTFDKNKDCQSELGELKKKLAGPEN